VRRPKNLKIHWTPVVISLALAPFCLVKADVLGDRAHDYALSIILFPYAMLPAFLFYSLTFFIPLAILQYPVYGIILGRASYKGHLGRVAIYLLAAHLLAIGFLYLVLRLF
jgi:hypothetical protein